MQLSDQEQVIALLTLHLGNDATKEKLKPLNIKEWNEFVSWILKNGIEIEQLIDINNLEIILQNWTHAKITTDRLYRLLSRGTQLGFLLNKWSGFGIYLLFKFDNDYPKKIKEKLKNKRPPIFFACGSRKLLNSPSIAVIGSRNTSPENLAFSRKVGNLAAQNGFSIVSGVAKGVDEEAMLGALENDGTAIGFIADSFTNKITSSKYRRHIRKKNLLILSVVNPDASFNVGNAMQRNKYIYCFSEKALVVDSTYNKGGTWSGAIENLREKWTNCYVLSGGGKCKGNEELEKKGATPINSHNLEEQLFDNDVASETEKYEEIPFEEIKQSELFETSQNETQDNVFDSFIRRLSELTKNKAKSRKTLYKEMGLKTNEFDELIKEGIKKGLVEKSSKPILYKNIVQE